MRFILRKGHNNNRLNYFESKISIVLTRKTVDSRHVLNYISKNKKYSKTFAEEGLSLTARDSNKRGCLLTQFIGTLYPLLIQVSLVF